MYKKILVPLDGSILAECALTHGMNFMKTGFAEEMIILNVVRENFMMFEYGPSDLEIIERCKNEAMKYRPGKKYNVSGKVDIYYFYNPEDDGDNSFIRKYFTRTNKLELDNTNFFKCVK